ncbi:substrate-binding domain-containing protein [Microbacterium oleivorans]|uniref:substrate-binding domain-containing protein n=1 Tax=Microbacterium TaxID=33882 RepID=UPI0033DB4CDF
MDLSSCRRSPLVLTVRGKLSPTFPVPRSTSSKPGVSTSVTDAKSRSSVPEDIAVTGYDNNHFASESAVPISTVAQPGEEMGQRRRTSCWSASRTRPTGTGR